MKLPSVPTSLPHAPIPNLTYNVWYICHTPCIFGSCDTNKNRRASNTFYMRIKTFTYYKSFRVFSFRIKKGFTLILLLSPFGNAKIRYENRNRELYSISWKTHPIDGTNSKFNLRLERTFKWCTYQQEVWNVKPAIKMLYHFHNDSFAAHEYSLPYAPSFINKIESIHTC